MRAKVGPNVFQFLKLSHALIISLFPSVWTLCVIVARIKLDVATDFDRIANSLMGFFVAGQQHLLAGAVGVNCRKCWSHVVLWFARPTVA